MTKMIRLDEETHREVKVGAAQQGTDINGYIKLLLERIKNV